MRTLLDAVTAALTGLDIGDATSLRLEARRGATGWAVDVRAPGADERRVAELADLAAHDPLTGLANRRSFDAALASAGASADELALVLFDLDHFKAINDRFGHPVGDRVLVEATARLRAVARPDDVLARTGGEELAWLLPATSAEEAVAAADRARAALAAAPVHEGVEVTASAGVCTLADGGDDPVARADQALYWAKAQGRNATVRWTPAAAARLAHIGEGYDGLLHAARTVDAVLEHQPPTAVDETARADGHGARVADLAAAMAEALGWPPERTAQLHRAARLHDVGKASVSDALLAHPGRLSAGALRHVRAHAEAGAARVAPVLGDEAAGWVRHHHERWDGRGYPDRLAGEAVPDGAQLLAIADAFDAMVSSRPYRPARPMTQALSEVDRCSGTAFRPDAAGLLRAALAWLAGRAAAEPAWARSGLAVAVQ